MEHAKPLTTFEKALQQAGCVAEAALGQGHNAPVREIVIAVLEAIREPDEAMLRAAGEEEYRDDWSAPSWSWPLMIDELLKEANGG